MSGYISVSEAEYKLLKLLVAKGVKPNTWYSVTDLSRILGVDRSWLESIVRLLSSKGLLKLAEELREEYRVTDEGLRYLHEGFPEEKLVKLLASSGGRIDVDTVIKRLGDEARIAIVNAVRKGWVKVESGVVKLLVDASRAKAEERDALKEIIAGGTPSPSLIRLLTRRGLIERRRTRVTRVMLVDEPTRLLDRVVLEVGALTHELLASGEWRRVRLRSYDVTASPPTIYPGRTHPLVDFIELVRDVMVEMGFQEVDAPAVDTEFWVYDALFQPQYHPARRPTDTFYLSNPSTGDIPLDLALRVAKAHETGVNGSRGWGYKWSLEKALRMVLRSHTTSVSARTLASKPNPPFRVFTIGRVYRVESIDPKHLPEFHQLDGIACEEDTSFSYLLSLLSEFFERLGIKEYKFRPAYFPFTEPSAEGYVRVAGEWIEALGCGIFRPEVVKPLGIDYPVAAWGIGLERIAMAVYGVKDIRHLYSMDISMLRRIPILF